jgi:hypothetical protein
MHFSYSFQDWLTDFGWILESSMTLKKEDSTKHAREFFHSRYSDPIEADWKMDRQLKAYRYLDKHIESFEAASLAIASKKQATISKPVGIALFRFFGHATDEQVLNEPPPNIMVAAAREHLNE